MLKMTGIQPLLVDPYEPPAHGMVADAVLADVQRDQELEREDCYKFIDTSTQLRLPKSGSELQKLHQAIKRAIGQAKTLLQRDEGGEARERRCHPETLLYHRLTDFIELTSIKIDF